jgi:hypothetical protein
MTDNTVKVLRDIRDEIHGIRRALEHMSQAPIFDPPITLEIHGIGFTADKPDDNSQE